jgi:hypothetical protein
MNIPGFPQNILLVTAAYQPDLKSAGEQSFSQFSVSVYNSFYYTTPFFDTTNCLSGNCVELTLLEKACGNFDEKAYFYNLYGYDEYSAKKKATYFCPRKSISN